MEERPSNRQLGQRLRRERERASAHRSIEETGSSLRGDVDRENVLLHTTTITLPFARRSYVEPIEPLFFGPMNVKCTHCAGFHWLDERLTVNTVRSLESIRMELPSTTCVTLIAHYLLVILSLSRFLGRPFQSHSLFVGYSGKASGHRTGLNVARMQISKRVR
jgi:hypothetical protein